MSKKFTIIDYYTGKPYFDFTFETYQIAMRYWKLYTRNDVMFKTIIIKEI
jgi:hypothetical protein